MKPNMSLAPERHTFSFQIYFDIASKTYGIRQSQELIKDGVYIEAVKSLDLGLEDLEKLVEDAKYFIGIHKKY